MFHSVKLFDLALVETMARLLSTLIAAGMTPSDPPAAPRA